MTHTGRIIDAAEATGTEVVVLILMNRDANIVLVRKFGNARWELPATRIAEGETLEQAAVRVAWFEVGVVLDLKRISRPVARRKTQNGVRLVSVRANISDIELDMIGETNPSGSHECMIVTVDELGRYLPRKDRSLLAGGHHA